MCIAVEDDMSVTAINEMYSSFPNSIEQIHTGLEKGYRVHCRAGYLMTKYNYFLTECEFPRLAWNV
jgi:hypothetical protein